MMVSHARMRIDLARLAGMGFFFAAALAIQACAAPAPDPDRSDDGTPRPAVERLQEPDDRPDGPGIL